MHGDGVRVGCCCDRDVVFGYVGERARAHLVVQPDCRPSSPECADSSARGDASHRAHDASAWTPDPLLLQRPTRPTASSDPISPLHMLFTHAVSILACVRAREVVLPSLPFHRSITSSPENRSCSFQTQFSPISGNLEHNQASSFDPPTSKYPQVA